MQGVRKLAVAMAVVGLLELLYLFGVKSGTVGMNGKASDQRTNAIALNPLRHSAGAVSDVEERGHLRGVSRLSQSPLRLPEGDDAAELTRRASQEPILEGFMPPEPETLENPDDHDPDKLTWRASQEPTLTDDAPPEPVALHNPWDDDPEEITWRASQEQTLEEFTPPLPATLYDPGDDDPEMLTLRVSREPTLGHFPE